MDRPPFTCLMDNPGAMVGEDLELVITAVVAADGAARARAACARLLDRVGGRVLRVGDCSDEEPGCWSLTLAIDSGQRVPENVAAGLARAVRGFVRDLGFPAPRISCEPPTAWTVLDDPDVLDPLVPGAERLLVEAWAGGDPQYREPEPAAEPDVGPQPEPGTRLLLRVDVATDRAAGAEWQARAVASRVARSGKITRVAPRGDLLSVHVDLGTSIDPPAVALLDAVASLGRPGWSAPTREGESTVVRWSATPVPTGGIAALELTATPASAFVWTEPD
ncbi:hypothetical protein GCM10022243_11760 [Saccharothrix violaceirubra]|uniref:Uncharacterized protein n=1 Tax=Saccharothrix violaceirubra TaxID=413306 RepID=A0A7W7WYQ0_9PSEU|nr:hypothetical protein [Saccharothrix violaceirubra]MBB4968675.1 hypothetical protein [Saccharothrix violaceirubra]